MIKKILFLSLSISLFVFLFACEEDKSSSVEGTYLGNTYRVNTWANPQDSLQQRDTTYLDTFQVELTGNSIRFRNGDQSWVFEQTPDHEYIQWNGTHSNHQFGFPHIDSLTYSYWSYGGFGVSFSQTNIDFIGGK